MTTQTVRTVECGGDATCDGCLPDGPRDPTTGRASRGYRFAGGGPTPLERLADLPEWAVRAAAEVMHGLDGLDPYPGQPGVNVRYPLVVGRVSELTVRIADALAAARGGTLPHEIVAASPSAQTDLAKVLATTAVPDPAPRVSGAWRALADRLRACHPDPETWAWRCLSCSTDSTPAFGEPPTCDCGDPAYASLWGGPGEPHERAAVPNPHGDWEDRTIYLAVVHGGTATGRRQPGRTTGPPTVAVWIPEVTDG